MDRNKIIKKYAELLIKKGIGVKKGEKINLHFNRYFYDFAIEVSKLAYKNGANHVELKPHDKELTKAAYKYLSAEELKNYPNFKMSEALENLAYKYSRISIDGTVQFETLKDIDLEKFQEVSRYLGKSFKFLRDSIMKDESKWLNVAYPSREWANKIYGNQDEDNLDKLWDVFAKILRLDHDDPVAFWKEHCDTIEKRANKLNDLKIEYLNFKNKDTDLKIYINKKSIWLGAKSSVPNGDEFVPNLPTEEVFTAPNFRKTEGYVKVARPVMVFNNLVKDAYFEFKDGSVVNFDASEGKEFLEKFLDLDEGSRRLGEVALVDCDSPIYQSGLVFSNILFDENASCHIALGRAYPTCIEGYQNLNTSKELMEAGCNDSISHTDFMIGTNDTTIYAKTFDGKEITIFKDGHFTI